MSVMLMLLHGNEFFGTKIILKEVMSTNIHETPSKANGQAINSLQNQGETTQKILYKCAF